MSSQPTETAPHKGAMPPTLTPAEGDQPLIAIRELKVHFYLGGGTAWDKITGGSPVRKVVKAVDGVSIDIFPGETLGLVGESGCGKSTLGRALLRLTEPTGGQVLFRGSDLARLSQGQMRKQRRHLQMIFQDPYASLNPRMTVAQIIGEPLETFDLVQSKREGDDRVRELMETVGLKPPLRQALPARVLGRAAPAHRHRARSGRQPRLHRGGRTHLGARRVHPGADHEPDGEAPARPQPDVPLHLPRPARHPPRLRPRGRDVPRQARRAGRRPRHLRRPADALHEGAHLRRPRPRPRHRGDPPAHGLAGRRALADQPAVRAAASTRAAPTPFRRARRSSRPSPRSSRTTSRPASASAPTSPTSKRWPPARPPASKIPVASSRSERRAGLGVYADDGADVPAPVGKRSPYETLV